MNMFSEQHKEIIELLANIATIFGFIIGGGYVYKIYSKIDITIQGENIAFVNEMNFAFPIEGYQEDSHLEDFGQEEIYENKRGDGLGFVYRKTINSRG